MRPIATAACLLLPFAIVAPAQQPKDIDFTHSVVIESISDDSATIAWSTNTGGSVVVKYGTEPQKLDKTAQSEYARGAGTKRARISNLQPNTQYYFQVVSGQAQGSGTEVKSEVMQLRTLGSEGRLVPLYRLVNGNQHLFTTTHSEARGSTERAAGWKREGVAAHLSKDQLPGTVALHRLVAPNNNHFYTTNEQEKDSAVKNGYRYEGVAGYVGSSQLPGTVPFHRFYSPQQNVHFYTVDEGEMAKLKADGNYRYEGVTGYVWAQGQARSDQ